MQSVVKSNAVQFARNHIIVYLFVFSYCVVSCIVFVNGQ